VAAGECLELLLADLDGICGRRWVLGAAAGRSERCLFVLVFLPFFRLFLVFLLCLLPSQILEVFFFILRWIRKRQRFSLRRCGLVRENCIHISQMSAWPVPRLMVPMDPPGTAGIDRNGRNRPEWRPVRDGESSTPFWCTVRDVSVVPTVSEQNLWLCLDSNFGVPKYTVAFRLYLVIIVQSLTN
jgi:hypothetical protein